MSPTLLDAVEADAVLYGGNGLHRRRGGHAHGSQEPKFGESGDAKENGTWRMEYQIGDSVVWLTENGSVVPSFSIRLNRNDMWEWNAGEPSVRNALLLDIPKFGSETIGTCPHCAVIHVALAVRVADGVFAEISFLNQHDVHRVFGEPPVVADIAVIHPDGSFEPRLDWYDHPLDTTAVVKK